MGSLLAYSLYTSVFLLAGYLLYKWAMAGEKQFSLNRTCLLVIYAAALLARPLAEITLHAGSGATGAVNFEVEMIVADTAAESVMPVWPRILLWVYLVGSVAVGLWSILVVGRIASIIRSGERIEGTNIVLVEQGSVAPFSWMNYIVMGRDDYMAAGSLVEAHERAHIRLGHWLDLLLAQAVCVLCWYNPAAWLMREELKSVHEYQADDAVLRAGADARQYQMLLIKRAVGTRFQSLANSLNHSKLKKRITMMYKSKSRGVRKWRAASLAVAAAAAMAVVNQPAVAQVFDTVADTALTVSESKVSDFSAPGEAEATEKQEKSTPTETGTSIAQFSGGQEALFKFLIDNVKYPKEAEGAQEEGRVAVRFTIEADGTISNAEIIRSVSPALDAESLRVINSMPKWEPATENGKAVSSSYVLPVSFKLTDKSSDNTSCNLSVYGEGYGEKSNTVWVTTANGETSQFVPTPENCIVDGKPYSPSMGTIDPSTIESIGVVQDDAHPNGLVTITTKK